MIQIKEEKIAELMFDIWHKSNDLKNPVMVGEYIAEELTKVKNLAIPVVGWRSEQLPEFDVQEINEILQDCKEKKEDLLTLISRIWNKGYMTAVCDEREG